MLSMTWKLKHLYNAACRDICNHFETHWQLLKILKIEIPYDQVSGIYSRENEKLYPHKISYTDIHSNVIHHNQKLESIQISIN